LICIPEWRKEQIFTVASQTATQYVDTYPIMVMDITNKMGIKLRPYSQLTPRELSGLKKLLGPKLKDGFWLNGSKNGVRVDNIFYNDAIQPIERQKFTVAHELGHAVLDHSEESDLAEAEANLFASYILAPPELIHLIQPEDYIDIASKFQLSKSCASFAFNRYKRWLKKKENSENKDIPEYELKMVSTYQNCFKIAVNW